MDTPTSQTMSQKENQQDLSNPHRLRTVKEILMDEDDMDGAIAAILEAIAEKQAKQEQNQK